MEQLGINLPGLIAQIVNFAVLLIILRMLLYKPILRMLDQRKERIREGLAGADRAAERAVEAEAEVQQQLAASRAEGQALIAQAQQIAERLREERRSQAETEAQALLERARGEIRLERDAAIAQLRRDFADLTITAAEKVIGQSLDKQAHQQLIDQTLNGLNFSDN